MRETKGCGMQILALEVAIFTVRHYLKHKRKLLHKIKAQPELKELAELIEQFLEAEKE